MKKRSAVVDPWWIQKIKKWGPCNNGLNWLRTQPDLKTAWRTCQNGYWMEWLLNKTTLYIPEAEVYRKRFLSADRVAYKDSFENTILEFSACGDAYKACELRHTKNYAKELRKHTKGWFLETS